jgi:hypothetical protein
MARERQCDRVSSASMRPLGKADRITGRKWRSLEWRDPRTDLVSLGRTAAELEQRGITVTNDDLRQRALKAHLERKQGALFAHFVSYAILKAPIAYAMVEDEDYDCVLWWKVDGKSHYARVQLKEIVPPHINPNATIEFELAKLGKYPTSEQTIVAVHVNQEGLLVWSAIAKPTTSVAEIWLYSSLEPDQSRWFLYGDLLNRPQGFEIPWPTT